MRKPYKWYKKLSRIPKHWILANIHRKWTVHNLSNNRCLFWATCLINGLTFCTRLYNHVRNTEIGGCCTYLIILSVLVYMSTLLLCDVSAVLIEIQLYMFPRLFSLKVVRWERVDRHLKSSMLKVARPSPITNLGKIPFGIVTQPLPLHTSILWVFRKSSKYGRSRSLISLKELLAYYMLGVFYTIWV